MENNQTVLKIGEKSMRRCGIFSVNLSSFILICLLTLNIWMVSVSAEKDSETETENKSNRGSVENLDPIAQPSIKEVLSLLKNIQVELAALSNKTTQENEELKSQLADLHVDQKQIKQKIQANHEEVKKELAIFNQNQSQQQGIQVQSQSCTAPACTPPTFYLDEQFQGSSYTPTSDDWKTKCINLPLRFTWTSSLKTGGNCLLLCLAKDCKPWHSDIFDLERPCHTINVDTKEVGNLSKLGIDAVTQSFRLC